MGCSENVSRHGGASKFTVCPAVPEDQNKLSRILRQVPDTGPALKTSVGLTEGTFGLTS